MRLTSLVVWKSWVSNRTRTALTILGIALGVAVVVAIHVMDHNTIQSQLRQLRPDSGRVDFELIPIDRTRDPGEVRAELQAMDGIGSVGLLHQATVAVARSDDATPAHLRMFGLSPLPSSVFAHYLISQGADISDLDGDEFVLISDAVASLLQVAVGDSLVVGAPTVKRRALCKGGQLVESDAHGDEPPAPQFVKIRGILAPTALAKRNQGLVMVGSFALARRMAPGQHTYFQVNREYGADADHLRAQLAEDFTVHDEHSALIGEASDERAFRNGVKILGCLALVLGMFVVFQALSQSLVERLRQIGLLRCLGASRRAIVSIFLVDALAMALVGVALGVGGGLVLAYTLQTFKFTTLGVGKTVSTFEMPLVPILWTGALGFLFTLTGALFPLYKARNLSAVRILNSRSVSEKDTDVLKGVNVFLFVLLVLVLPGAFLAMTTLTTESERETRAVLMQLGGLILAFGTILLLSPKLVSWAGSRALSIWRGRWPLPTFLVERNLQRSGGRYAASICGLSVVLVAIIALKSITTALRGEIIDFGDRTMVHRVFVGTETAFDSGGGAMSRAALSKLAEVPGVRSVQLHEGRRSVPFLLSGVALDSAMVEGGVFERGPELAKRYVEERSVVVSRRLARLKRLQAGEVVEVLTDEGSKPYVVLAVTDEVGFWVEERAWAVTDPKWMRRDFCVGVDSVGAATLHLEDGLRANEALKRRIQAIAPSFTKFKPGESIVDYHLRDLWRDFLLFDVLLGLILVLAGVGLVNQMTIAAMGRIREIGVLRALGMAKRQLARTFLVESMVVAVLAALTAVVLGLPLGWLVVRGLNQVTGLQAPYAVPWLALLAVIVIAGLTGWLAAILPGRRAAQLSPAESVRYE